MADRRWRRALGRAGVRPGQLARVELALACLAGAIPAPAASLAAEDCGKAAWPLEAERALLTGPAAAVLRPGAALTLPLQEAVELELEPQAAARLPFSPRDLPPERADAFAGAFALHVPSPGRVWQITISASAWIDVLVDGRALVPVALPACMRAPASARA